MALNPDLLRGSFQLVIERAPDLTARFYRVLFRRNPELEALFHRRPLEVQERMLGEALGAVLDHLEDAPWLTEQLGALGAKHVEYGVAPEMYGTVGGALLETLSAAAGSAWTQELEAQWAEAFGAIRDLMLAGANAQRA